MRIRRTPWCAIPLLLLLVLAIYPPSTVAQDAGASISIDTPSDGQSFFSGDDIIYTGWAAHGLGPGTGVDRVLVLDAPMGSGGRTVAEATYGQPRPDVGAAFGTSWTNSGFRATEQATGSGNVTRWVYAHSMANDGWTNKTVTIRVTVAPTPTPLPRAVSDRFGLPYGPGYGGAPYGGGYGGGPYGGGYGGAPYGGGYPYSSFYGGPPPYSGIYGSPFFGGSPFYGGGPFSGGLYGSPFGYPSGPFPPSSTATPNITVSMVPGAFSPATVNTTVGSTVLWTNADPVNPHTATSDIRLWDSGTVFPGQSYAFTFSAAGTYTYYCRIHGHRGTIVVS